MIPTPLPPTMASDRRFSSEVISTESTAAKEGKRASRASRLYERLLDEGAGRGVGGKAELVFGYEVGEVLAFMNTLYCCRASARPACERAL